MMDWLQGVSQGAANVLVSGIWQGFVLALGILILLRLMPKLSAATRFVIWIAAFLILALLPLLRLPHSAQSGTTAIASSWFLQIDMRWSFAIAALWLICSICRVGSLMLHGFSLRALWRSATPVDSSAVAGLLAGVDARGVRLCTSSDLDQPSVIGFFSPRILIPRWLFEKLTPAELQQIVLHEVEHLRRGDDWINLLQKLSMVMFPLNPVLVWIEKRLCFERELACDDSVVHATRAPRAYATCLTSLAEQSLDRRTASLALGAWGRRSAIAGRVHSLLRRGEMLSPRQARSVTATVVIAMLVGAATLSQCPQLVSFSAPPGPVKTLAVAAPSVGYPSARLQNVVYHPARTPRATVMHASLRSKSATVPASTVNAVDVPRAHRSPSRRSGVVQDRTQYWIVLTSWTDSRSQARPWPASNYPSTISPYAAVPTEDGWIIVQL